ncbi:MAG: hypothetical protein ACI9WU_002839 [Myxococcota bacterium]|jgi:hypothetical protein
MREERTVKFAKAIVIGWALLLAMPATAQFGGIKINVGGTKISPAKANATLRKLDGRLTKAFKLVQRPYGKDPAREMKDIEAAEKEAAAVKDDLSVDLRLGGSNYGKVEEKIKALQKAAQLGRLQQACSAARLEINTVNKTGKMAPDNLLAAFDKAAGDLEKALPGDKASTFWREEATKIRGSQKAIAEAAAAKAAEEKAANEARATRDAERALNEKIKGAKSGLTTINKALMAHIKTDEEPIDQSQLDAYKQAIGGVEAVAAGAGTWYHSQLRRFAIYNAFHSKDAGNVASAVGGELVTGGVTEGKQMKISFAAKKGHCYSLWSRWKNRTGGEKLKDWKWNAKKGNTHLQNYAIDAHNVPWNSTRGLCATKDTKVHNTAELVFAGTRNGLEYAVVGWSKDKFPVQEAVDMTVWSGDRCDVDHWKGLWMDPIPGSIMWQGKEAFLLTDPSRTGQSSVSMRNISGGDVRGRKQELADNAPKSVAFKSQFHAPRCAGLDSATSKLSIKLAKCKHTQREKYAKLFSDTRKRKEQAKRGRSWLNANAKLKALPEKRDKEYAAKCKPTRKKIEGIWEKTYNGLVDNYTDAAPAASIKRAEHLTAEDKSHD